MDRYARITLLALAACHASPSPPPLDNHGAAIEPFEITLKRTICFGRCPAYSVTVKSDGTVRWHGDTDVAAHGDRSGRVTGDQLVQILAAIERAHFFDLQDDGTEPCREPNGLCSDTICGDTSRSLVKITRAGRTKEIDNAHCVPSPSDTLEDLVDKLANTDRWVGNL